MEHPSLTIKKGEDITKHEDWIDILRAFACIMVLFCHSPQPYLNQPGQFLMPVINYYGMAWGPILFFMISGACIMHKEQPALPFFKKRFGRILIPTIIWSIIYVFIECEIWKTCPHQELLNKLMLLPFAPQYGLMWFMYALIAIYLMTPIISLWLHRCEKGEIQLYIALWGITLFIPYTNLFDFKINLLTSPNGLLFYLSGFLWMAVLGYYCRRYDIVKQWRYWHILISVLILFSPLYIYVIKHITGNTISSSLSVDSVATTALAFLCLKNVTIKGYYFNLVVKSIAKHSFGIYLIHMLFMYPFRQWIAQYNINYAFQIPITVFVVGCVSFLATVLLSKIPYSKYILG